MFHRPKDGDYFDYSDHIAHALCRRCTRSLLSDSAWLVVTCVSRPLRPPKPLRVKDPYRGYSEGGDRETVAQSQVSKKKQKRDQNALVTGFDPCSTILTILLNSGIVMFWAGWLSDHIIFAVSHRTASFPILFLCVLSSGRVAYLIHSTIMVVDIIPTLNVQP